MRHVAHDAHPSFLQPKYVDCCSTQSYYQQGSGKARRNPPEQHQQPDAGQAEGQRQEVDFAELLGRVPEEPEDRGGGFEIHAEQVLQLAQPDNDGRRRGKPADNGVGEEIDHEPHPQEAEPELDPSDHEGQERGQGYELAGAGLGQGRDAGKGQQRDEGDGTYGQVA